MPEREQAPVSGRPDEIPRAQAVERSGVRRDPGRGGRKLGIERITGHRGAGEDAAATSSSDPVSRRTASSRQCGRASLPAARASSRRYSGLPAAAVTIASCPLAGWAEATSASDAARSSGSSVRTSNGGSGARTGRDDEQVRDGGRAADEMVEQLERGIVGPVQVVEHQHRRALARELRRERPVRVQARGR